MVIKSFKTQKLPVLPDTSRSMVMKTKIISNQNIFFYFLLLGSSFHSYIIVCVFMMCKLIMHTTKGYVFKVACNECSAKMKKCLICGELITEKVVIIRLYS